jgi:transmembrane sensor
MTTERQIEQLRKRRAAEWLQTLGEGDAVHNSTFVAWLAESPLNLEAFLKITALSVETRSALKSLPFDQDALLQSLKSNVVSLTAAKSLNRRRSRWRRWGAVAAAFGLLFVAGVAVREAFFGADRYDTEAGEQRTLNLADGSVVYLNTLSEVRVDLTDQRRDIRLVRGEALFKVAVDPKRAFRVLTSDAMIQAIGTQFNVATRSDGTRVAVLEGKVQVLPESAPTFQSKDLAPMALKAGETVRVTRAGRIESRPSSETTSAVAWRQRQLAFEGTTLEEAVAEFNRYHRSKRLRLDGVQPGSHHYSGTFDVDDVESFAALLGRERDLEVERRGDEIVIRAK